MSCVNKKQLVKLLREQRPETPVGYEARIEARLARLVKEEQMMRRKYKVSTVLLAAVLIVLLAGTAFALGYSELMEYLQRGGIKPLDGTEEMIQTEFGSETTEGSATDAGEGAQLVEFRVEEAIYDGRSVIIQALIAPVNPETHALFNAGLQDSPEAVYEREIICEEGGAEQMRVTGRKDGRKIIFWSMKAEQEEEDAGCSLEMDKMDAEELADGSIRVWLEGSVVEGSADAIELNVVCSYQLSDEMEQPDGAGTVACLTEPIKLTTTAAARTAKLVPVGGSKGERFEILNAWIEFNPVSGQITIDYSYLPDRTNERMGIDFRIYDGENNRIEQGTGSSILVELREDGTEVSRKVSQIQSFEEFPEKLYLEAKVIGEERTLGRVEFSVEEGAIVIPSVEEMEREEKKPDGLLMKPDGSWEGERFTLLDGRISHGRTVEIEFAYDGDMKELTDVEVRYLWQDGTPVGEAITSVSVTGEESIRRTDKLDGSGWPSEMTVEFVKGGTVIDSFVCWLYDFYE